MEDSEFRPAIKEGAAGGGEFKDGRLNSWKDLVRRQRWTVKQLDGSSIYRTRILVRKVARRTYSFSIDVIVLIF